MGVTSRYVRRRAIARQARTIREDYAGLQARRAQRKDGHRQGNLRCPGSGRGRVMSPETARHSRPEVSNEERYRALLHSVSTFVWVADAGGQFSVPQPGWEKYTGHGFDQHGGTGWISDVHPDDRAHVGEVWNQALQSKSWYEVAWRCWHGASQSWRQCITRGVPVTDQAGFVREWIGAVLDIEDRVDFELKR